MKCSPLEEDRRSSAWTGPSLLMFVFSFVTAFTNFFLPIYFRDTLGYSGTQIGILFGVLAVTAIVAALPVGLGADRVTPRRILAFFFGLLSVAAYGMAYMTHFGAYVGVFILFGISINGIRIALDTLYLKTNHGTETGIRMGVFQALRMVGIALGTAIGGYFLERIAFRSTLLVLSLASAGMLIGTIPLPATRTMRLQFAEYRSDFFSRKVVLFLAWLFLYTTHWGAEQTSYALFLQDTLHLSLAGMGCYMGAEFIPLGLAVWWCGRVSDRGRSLRAMAIAGLILSGVGHIAMCMPHLYVSFLARLVHGLGDGALTIVVYVGMARYFHFDRMGGNYGLVFLVVSASSVIGSLVYGPLGQSYGYAFPLVTSGIVTLLISPVVYLIPKGFSLTDAL